MYDVEQPAAQLNTHTMGSLSKTHRRAGQQPVALHALVPS